MTRSQIEFAFGLASGDRNTCIPKAPTNHQDAWRRLVSVMEKLLMRAFLSDDRSQLLQRPIRARIRCHVDVCQPTRHVLVPGYCDDRSRQLQHALIMPESAGGYIRWI